MSADPLTPHLLIDRYGDFRLTEAIRPGPTVPIAPRAGYRLQSFRDPQTRERLPMLAAAVSREDLFDTFLDLLAPLGDVVHVILESSHGIPGDDHRDLHRTDIDLPVLISHLLDHEDLLLNDGCTGIAVLSSRRDREVQFDEHKLLYVYANNRRPFTRLLHDHGVDHVSDLRLISEAEHLHGSKPHHEEDFWRLCHQLGAGNPEEIFTSENWD